MIIESFTIKNYRSIKSLTLPLRSFGIEENESHTTILVGLNESGKSSILEAIYSLATDEIEKDFYDVFHKNSDAEHDKYIDIFAEINDKKFNFYIEKILEQYKIFESKSLKIKSLSKNIWKSSTRSGFQFFFRYRL